jgi:hypothetical protein
LVLSEKKLCGVISERDYTRKVILKGNSSKKASVESIMTRKLSKMKSDATVEEALKLMTVNESATCRYTLDENWSVSFPSEIWSNGSFPNRQRRSNTSRITLPETTRVRARSKINPPLGGSAVLSDARHEEDEPPHDGDSTDELRRIRQVGITLQRVFKSVTGTLKRELQRIPCFSFSQ